MIVRRTATKLKKKVDQSEDPIYTVKCQSCGYLWKAEGDTFSG